MAFLAMNSDINSMRKELAELARLPADAPQGLPGRFYTDEGWFAHECDTVLKGSWHCLGRVDEIPNEGDYLTITLLGEPLIIVRDEAQIRVLSNVCRHRGMPLVQGSGNTRRFTCPYHAWMYGIDGRLQRAGGMKNDGFDAASCRLGEFECVERFGFVYVSLVSDPAPIDEAISGLPDLIDPYRPGEYRIVHSASEVWNCNWKALVENFMEGYHLSVVHPQTLRGYTPTSLCEKGPSGSGFTSYFANYPDDVPSRGRGAKGLNDRERHRSTLFSVFPCQVASIAASLLVSLSILPVSTGSINVRWTMSVYGDDLDDGTIAERIALWEKVNCEDREKLELMQTALGSRFAQGGPLAGPDFEGTIHDFVKWLANQDLTG